MQIGNFRVPKPTKNIILRYAILKNCATSNIVLQIKDNLRSGYQSKLLNTYFILYRGQLGKFGILKCHRKYFLHKLFCSTNEEMYIILALDKI